MMELELTTPVAPEAVPEQLNALAPAGLIITHVEAWQPDVRQGSGSSHAVSVPRSERAPAASGASHRAAGTTPRHCRSARAGRPEPIDLKADLMSVTLEDGAVCFTLRATDRASARPRDVLQALGLADLEQQGHFLTRCSSRIRCATSRKPQVKQPSCAGHQLGTWPDDSTGRAMRWPPVNQASARSAPTKTRQKQTL